MGCPQLEQLGGHSCLELAIKSFFEKPSKHLRRCVRKLIIDAVAPFLGKFGLKATPSGLTEGRKDLVDALSLHVSLAKTNRSIAFLAVLSGIVVRFAERLDGARLQTPTSAAWISANPPGLPWRGPFRLGTAEP
ncbi:hypothetical protein SPHV1_560005 [Novosphingobium sp. KN65.2]|nr:hypothetical protein SPHV1_560005 [Novosphingobium sp. KN65.2]